MVLVEELTLVAAALGTALATLASVVDDEVDMDDEAVDVPNNAAFSTCKGVLREPPLAVGISSSSM